jgi:predicted nucleic acid-binding Zn ribbon protein
MAKYDYKCDECEVVLEESHPIGEAPETSVHRCINGVYQTMHKVILPAAVSFKGSGFYSTDSRTKHVRKSLKVGGQ